MSLTTEVISVSELNRKARLAIEKSLPSCWVVGEISNFTMASSGHWYFTLKDAQSSVKCAFFRNRNQFTDWRPSEGSKIEVRAQATLYEPRGDYQLVVDAMRRAGQGNLFEEFLRLKAKLEAEGLFRSDLKRPLASIPEAVGIITSLQAAALHDVLQTLQIRWPLSKVVIYPCAVQGTEAATSIMQALQVALQRNECNVLLMVRGGGSLEDLYAYNDENLARAIRSSHIPVIAGIGHETDFSIADFVADLRAATPTAAAQFAVPDKTEAMTQVLQFRLRAEKIQQHILNQRMQFLDGLSRRLIHPGNRIQMAFRQIKQISTRISLNSRYLVQRHVDSLQLSKNRLSGQRPDLLSMRIESSKVLHQLASALNARFAQNEKRLVAATSSLLQLNPENILSRGYCIVQERNGTVVRQASSLTEGCEVIITVKSGQLNARVTHVKDVR